MPNWCANKLVVTGPPAAVTEFCRTVARGMPPERVREVAELVAAPANGGSSEVAEIEHALADDGYTVLSFAETVRADERLEKVLRWGTKSDADEPRLEHRSDGLAVYHFGTAYEPPIAWLVATGPLFPQVNFELVFVEPNMRIIGRCSVHDTEVDEETFCQGSQRSRLAEYGLEECLPDWWDHL